MSDKLHPIPQALRDAIRNRQVVVVVGAGVSIQATGNAPAASWKGLIRLGIEACPRWNSQHDDAWVKRKFADLDSGDRLEQIQLANQVRERIGTTKGRLEEWLRETVGQLEVKSPAILDALHGLGCPIVTTNYDALLDRDRLKPVTWQQAGLVDRIIRGEDKGIIHLHGRFDAPDSVVLGIEDYVAVRDGAIAKAVREALAMTRTLLFVGYGDGLSDPNFTAFRRWMATVFPGRTSPHYRLCCDADRKALEKEHDPGERIDIIPYGKHEDLVGVLQSLASRPARPRQGVRRGSLPVSIEPNTGMAFVELPAGEFKMGSDAGHYDDERPVHTVRVSAFRMGRYPVTNAEYAKFLAAHPGARAPIFWYDSQFNDPRQPVVGIDWGEASEFCRWIGGRLPAEAEWEYACRAGTTTEYAFGTELSHEQANFDGKVGRTTPVDQYPANAWGLHDMHGNVWEWCADWYGKKYYESSPALDPQGPDSGEGRVLRGGGWYNPAVHCRSACRFGRRPGVWSPRRGFRVVLASRSVH